ncbi:acyl-CoA reductase [Halobacteriovorax sp. HLS]|uniref:acyl-CoA reductase n=1 Tax=Halobacteriovorax sp. HLS TaxID=2234000 RepID=UPI000FDC64A8|nr:acyl-CoA reductase [Halobacteriovorax sp. HLS]
MKILAKNLEVISKDQLEALVEESLELELSLSDLISTLDDFSKKVLELDYDRELLNEVSKFCSKEEIENKVNVELGSLDSFSLKKEDFSSVAMESFYPLGVVLHITPSNSPGLSFLAMVESLLGLNTNIVKVSRRDSDEIFDFCNLLFECDQSGKIKDKTIILKSSDLELSELINVSDAVSCWGGDSSIETIRQSVPVSKRFIPWGHKISFSLISRSVSYIESAKKLAEDIVKFDQQACSAPQICYLLDANFETLKEFSGVLSKELDRLSESKQLATLDIQEQAELTNIKELLNLESLFNEKMVLESNTNSWRIYIEMDSTFKASPLKRSIWVKPITKNSLIPILRQHRSHLQTAGILLGEEFSDITKQLYKAGVVRVRELGTMQDSYSGEPHDGEQALRRFVKRISLDVPQLKTKYRFSELALEQRAKRVSKVMTKEDFQALVPKHELAHLFFRSGGSSGKTAISPFSYNAYHTQMQAAAEGLYAAGLDPMSDRVANLFFGGGLYGGFLSFYTILEKLKVVQYPLAAYEDKCFVASILAECEVNTIVGMPSYIIELYESQKELLKKSKIKKIFFGGEHFGKKQRQWLCDEFGVELIRSASYGSVDAGPLGFQCEYSEGGIHHLNESIQDLEILKVDSDEAVESGEIGRLVFTSKARDCVDIERYDLGDLGRWITDTCPCGRKNRKFELLGRHGDIFRAGGTFFNFLKFQKLLLDEFEYDDSFQIVITNNNSKDHLLLRVVDKKITNSLVVEKYRDLKEAIEVEKMLLFDIDYTSHEGMDHSSNSGKLLRVIDKRII